MQAGDLWFSPERLELRAGETRNLVLDNTGATFHDLTLPDVDVTLAADPGERVAGALRVDTPGTYEFLCTVPGHADAGMRGVLVVVDGAS